MIVNFEKILTTKNDLEKYDRTKPENVAALLVHVICNYEPNNTDNFYDMLQYLMGEFQEISPMMKQNIKDRMMQNEKYKFIGKSYFEGSTPENEYTPVSYNVSVSENEYSRAENGYVRLLLKSGGADSLRFITVRLSKDGNYYVWSDSLIGLLTDIRKPESQNPWA